MAYHVKVLNHTFEVNEDLSESQFHAVVLDSEGQIGLPDTDGEVAIGILQEDPNADEYGAVMVYGISKAVFGETVEPGNEVAVESGGTLRVATAGDRVLGICLVGAGENETGTILISSSAVAP